MSSETLSEEELYQKIEEQPESGIGSFSRTPGESIWWVDTSDRDGLFLFSFDKKKVYNLFQDYPQKLTAKEKEIFDRENPFWANFFNPKKA